MTGEGTPPGQDWGFLGACKADSGTVSMAAC